MKICASCSRQKGLVLGANLPATYDYCSLCQQPRSVYTILPEVKPDNDSFNLLGAVLNSGLDIALGAASVALDVATDSGSSFDFGGGGGFSGGGSSGDF